jgi:TolB protein
MGDGGHQHLFAFHPNFLPITRLTEGDWDDSDPAISTDGNWLAFTSNRSGQWDIHLWDLVNNKIQQLTNTPAFESGIDWSPDDQWITYSSNSDGQSNIYIRSISDLTAAPIQLTDGEGNNIDPSWSAQGRQIAFSTNRNGHYEIWLAQLDKVENRFTKVVGDDAADYIDPAWSPDGKILAWEKKQEFSTVQIRTFSETGSPTIDFASGEMPFWSPDDKSILTRIDAPNRYFLTGYDSISGLMDYPIISLPSRTSQFHWGNGNSYNNLAAILTASKNTALTALCQPIQSVASGTTGRISLVPLDYVDVENAYLSDMADECFSSLRKELTSTLGWDLLSTLKSATLPVTAAPDPGIPENWLYTGRAITLNLAPYNAGWLAVSREDFDGLTYWRVWAKCLNQDGSCGQIISVPVWGFTSRASGDLQAFESGGSSQTGPEGYWVDITDIARQFGWERIPSQSNWRTYYPGILFNTFVFSQGKSWQQAMAELYPQDVIDGLKAGK